MAIEILTVSLSDESIDRIVTAVLARMEHPRSVTESNPPSSQNPQGAERSGFQPEGRAPESDGPWTNNAPPQQAPPQQAPQQNQQAQDGPPICKCGQPKRWVPPGFSKATGKAYQGFYACPQPRGQQCPRD